MQPSVLAEVPERISCFRPKSSIWLLPSHIKALQSTVKSPSPPCSALSAKFQRSGGGGKILLSHPLETWLYYFLSCYGRAQLCTNHSSWASPLATYRPAKQAFVHDKQTGNCLISSVHPLSSYLTDNQLT